MAELTYEDYKRRLSIQELLVDAGYRLNRRDGLRYPSYVRIDSDGRRVRGDKFIVTANGFCCFQPPECMPPSVKRTAGNTRNENLQSSKGR